MDELKNTKHRLLEIEEELRLKEVSHKIVGFGDNQYVNIPYEMWNKIKDCLIDSIILIDKTHNFMKNLKNSNISHLPIIEDNDVDEYVKYKTKYDIKMFN